MSFHYGDIHWCQFPSLGGREQGGRRPGIIWTDDRFHRLPVLFLIPFTTSLKALRFAGTALVHPTANNGLASDSAALVFQLGSFDRSRIGERLGRLDDPDLQKIADLARQLQRL